jgi:hypothetical protein
MKVFLFIGVILCSMTIFGQNKGSISGTITDREVFNEGIVFADVQIKNTDIKVQTNFRGRFEIKDLTPGNYTVQVNYLGYETMEIPVIIKDNEETYIAGSMAAKQLSFEDISSLRSSKDLSSNAESNAADLPKK